MVFWARPAPGRELLRAMQGMIQRVRPVRQSQFHWCFVVRAFVSPPLRRSSRLGHQTLPGRRRHVLGRGRSPRSHATASFVSPSTRPGDPSTPSASIPVPVSLRHRRAIVAPRASVAAQARRVKVWGCIRWG
eukprot:scaffold2858_cov659-Pavlova_lutheri.AAC.28